MKEKTGILFSDSDPCYHSSAAIPSPPGTPEATAVGKEHVIIEWLKPESDGGSEIKNYIVDKREKSSTRYKGRIQHTAFSFQDVYCVQEFQSRKLDSRIFLLNCSRPTEKPTSGSGKMSSKQKILESYFLD